MTATPSSSRKLNVSAKSVGIGRAFANHMRKKASTRLTGKITLTGDENEELEHAARSIQCKWRQLRARVELLKRKAEHEVPNLRLIWYNRHHEMVHRWHSHFCFNVTPLNSKGYAFRNMRSMGSVDAGWKMDTAYSEESGSRCKPLEAMHPLGHTRLVWNAFCLIFICWDLMTIPMQSFDVGEDSDVFYSIEWVTACFWTADLVLMFRTGYFIGSKVEMRAIKIALRYAQTWLLVDLIIVLSEWGGRFLGVTSSASLLRTSRVFRSIRLIKLLRLAKMRDMWTQMSDQITSNVLHLCIRMSWLTALLCFVVHVGSCIWYAVGTSESDGWTSTDIRKDTANDYYWYIASARWVVSQMNGRTDMDPTRNLKERLFTCVIGVCMSMLAQAVFISYITKAMLDLGELMSEKTRRVRVANKFLEHHQSALMLASVVKKCVSEYEDVDAEQKNEMQVLRMLPKHVQNELLLKIRSPIISHSPFFYSIGKQSSWAMQHLLLQVVKSEFASKYEIIFEKGESSTRMVFMDRIEVYYGEPVEEVQTAGGILEQQEDRLNKQKAARGSVLALVASRGSVRQEIKEEEETAALLAPFSNKLGHGPLKLMNKSGKHGHGPIISEPSLWINDWTTKGRLIADRSGNFCSVEAEPLANTLAKHPEAYALAAVYGKMFVAELEKQPRLSDVPYFEIRSIPPILLTITIQHASDLLNADGFLSGISDPYCICKVVGMRKQSTESSFKTKVINNCLNPVWNHTARVGIHPHQAIEFQVWDSEMFASRDKLLGVTVLDAHAFMPHGGFQGPLALSHGNSKKGEVECGTITVDIQVHAQGSLDYENLTQRRLMRGKSGCSTNTGEDSQGFQSEEDAGHAASSKTTFSFNHKPSFGGMFRSRSNHN